MDFLSYEVVSKFIGKAAQADLTEKLIIIGVCFWYINKKFLKTFEGFQEHLDRIERTVSDGFRDVAKNVGDLTKSMIKLETKHSNEIEALKKDVDHIKQILKEE